MFWKEVKDTYGHPITRKMNKLLKLSNIKTKTICKTHFLKKCIKFNVLPKSSNFSFIKSRSKQYKKNIERFNECTWRYRQRLVNLDIDELYFKIDKLDFSMLRLNSEIRIVLTHRQHRIFKNIEISNNSNTDNRLRKHYINKIKELRYNKHFESRTYLFNNKENTKKERTKFEFIW
ncbi:Protein of unknown function [Cotesia congregata]|uniref:Uncharacterized protein n=1 Tax=Cotesia congregata TaxID=51543 RepID=A0A8J2H8M2_COTCN|nr:Protein of unknown function [Cotesia congregata]